MIPLAPIDASARLAGEQLLQLIAVDLIPRRASRAVQPAKQPIHAYAADPRAGNGDDLQHRRPVEDRCEAGMVSERYQATGGWP